jgi:hypothetical protein
LKAGYRFWKEEPITISIQLRHVPLCHSWLILLLENICGHHHNRISNEPVKVGDKILCSPSRPGWKNIQIADHIEKKACDFFSIRKTGVLNCTREACYFRD